MTDDFSRFLIKEYEYWAVYIHHNKSYLGRCVVWCKRDNAIELTDATEKEQEELFLVLRELRETSITAFSPDWFNYSFLGNETHHLHGHFIPRYSSPKTFAGVTFEDKLYGHNYKTDHSFEISSDVLDNIQKRLKHHFHNNIIT